MIRTRSVVANSFVVILFTTSLWIIIGVHLIRFTLAKCISVELFMTPKLYNVRTGPHIRESRRVTMNWLVECYNKIWLSNFSRKFIDEYQQPKQCECCEHGRGQYPSGSENDAGPAGPAITLSGKLFAIYKKNMLSIESS